MSLERTPPHASSMPQNPSPIISIASAPSQAPIIASASNELCSICNERLDGKIECLIIGSCNHIFHRPCIENHLSTDGECPVCRLPCQLADLKQISFPGKPLKSTLRRGGSTKQYHTRSFSRNLFNEPLTPSVNVGGNTNTATLTNPSRNNQLSTQNPMENASSNTEPNLVPNVPQNNPVNYEEINRLIENNVAKLLQNLNLIPSIPLGNLPQNVMQNRQSLLNSSHGRNTSQTPQTNNNPLANSHFSPSSNMSNYPNDKITSIIQNWGLKFDGTSTGLTVEEFLYRLKSLTIDNFQGDFNIICKNLHILLTGKAREWFWRYHKQVDVINWNDFNEAIRFQYKDFKSSFDIREEIRNRKQKTGESFDMFYESLSTIMDRLPTPLSEMELIEIITRNLRPEIRHELLYIPIHSIPHLRKLVQMRESFLNDEYVRRNFSARTANQFPPRRHIAEIDFAHEQPMPLDVNDKPSIDAVQRDETTPRCWNCDQFGHYYQDCLEERTIFCYGCGAKSTYRPQCSKCIAKKASKNYKNNAPKDQ
ncbi:hypothetical protein CVS40_9745 [Lucilia cuprina]|nr:hypothetical protein CVS40_9745 [Lucilia cuprina]